MPFIEKMQKRMGNKKEKTPKRIKKELLFLIHKIKEREFLFLLKKINDSAEKAANYVHKEIETQYTLRFLEEILFIQRNEWEIIQRDEWEEFFTKMIRYFCKLFDQIIIDPKTFEFNVEILDVFKLRLADDIFIMSNYSQNIWYKKNGYKRKEYYKDYPFELLIIELGTVFLINNLYILIKEDLYDIELKMKHGNNDELILRKQVINNIKDFFECILDETSSDYYLYYMPHVVPLENRIESAVNYYGAKKLPNFKILDDNNVYIQMLKNKRSIT